MKKGDIIKYGSQFDFNKLEEGTILRVISPYKEESLDLEKFLNYLVIKVQDDIKVNNSSEVLFISINSGRHWTLQAANNYSFEIIRYGAK